MPKKIPRRSTKRPVTMAPSAPGLQFIYAALLTQIEDKSCALGNVQHSVPFASKILHEDLFVVDSDEALTARLMSAAAPALDSMTKHEDLTTEEAGPRRDELIAKEAFRVGIATCWLLMTEINGGVR